MAMMELMAEHHRSKHPYRGSAIRGRRMKPQTLGESLIEHGWGSEEELARTIELRRTKAITGSGAGAIGVDERRGVSGMEPVRSDLAGEDGGDRHRTRKTDDWLDRWRPSSVW
jgi:hypothetical protein